MAQDQNKTPDTAKKLISTAAVLLSACAAVFAFMLINDIDQSLSQRKRQKQYENEAAVLLPQQITQYVIPQITPDAVIIIPHGDMDIPEPQITPGTRIKPEDIIEGETPVEIFNGVRTEAPSRKHVNTQSEKSVFPYTVNNGSTNKKLVALTFDGGSNANAALDILDTLASRGVKSTMFLTGSFIKNFPGIVTNIASYGHELGNHTMTHPRMTTFGETKTQTTRPEISRQSVINELSGAEKILMERTGLRFAPLWRSPYGEYNREICQWAMEAGYLHVGWKQGGTWRENLDSNDWVPDVNHHAFKTPEQVFDKIINMAGLPQGVNGGIVLMHLGTERKQRELQVHLILGKLIDALREMGYEPVTVSELLHQSEIDINGLALQKKLQH
ncbi:MAG: polysaccharide deacetylase family protein [Chitinispirillales bacterium]|jgi:peptidoglycan/xylan/chitin deacetylase (PgdA/CDA1 family)|nr:polysaccharide deacetylase family protein [Chitinispirillales bacterium]